ncbi:uncharacterized protein EDB93DRAFT_1104050 [Suillus bovinus]|uniref:uncharacterized protein n=1 Tax=Suillus bovinus TaxID=48563 RepID=UPI001B86FBC1|nr:uncharacterized protein EDB93DRAFT_1104050 [Suillus bovinus]KAG2147779.1 hypothetical protein EDB93DRAFT_1104050 [Suillus bovinus]
MYDQLVIKTGIRRDPHPHTLLIHYWPYRLHQLSHAHGTDVALSLTAFYNRRISGEKNWFHTYSSLHIGIGVKFPGDMGDAYGIRSGSNFYTCLLADNDRGWVSRSVALCDFGRRQKEEKRLKPGGADALSVSLRIHWVFMEKLCCDGLLVERILHVLPSISYFNTKTEGERNYSSIDGLITLRWSVDMPNARAKVLGVQTPICTRLVSEISMAVYEISAIL